MIGFRCPADGTGQEAGSVQFAWVSFRTRFEQLGMPNGRGGTVWGISLPTAGLYKRAPVAPERVSVPERAGYWFRLSRLKAATRVAGAGYGLRVWRLGATRGSGTWAWSAHLCCPSSEGKVSCMSDKVNPLWDEFILWLSVPAEKRGLIATEEDWAKSKGYKDSRQLRRWKNDPRFVERQVELTGGSSVAVSYSTSAPGSVEEALLGDEADYRVVKAQLFDAAKGGNLKATELFMKLYGKSWIEEEAASRVSDFSGMDFDKLVAEALLVVAEDAVVAGLRARGWSVVPAPGGTYEGDSRLS